MTDTSPMHPAPRRATSNAVIGVLAVVGAATMFFAGLVSSLLVLRASSLAWPPPDQPRLPIPVTAFNLVVLLISGFTISRVAAATRRNEMDRASRSLATTLALGTTFLVVQGMEWVRLIQYGVRMDAEIYGGIFYTIIGAHGVHVLGGLLFLLSLRRKMASGVCSARNHAAVDGAQIYWSFVVAIWPVLYVLVYLI